MQSVLDAGFKKYGRVIADIDTSEIVKLMDSYDMPEDVVYVAGDEKLENTQIHKVMEESIYGGCPVQTGYCNGHNQKLNALEYHRSSEVNIAATDMILLLGKREDVKDDFMRHLRLKDFLCLRELLLRCMQQLFIMHHAVWMDRALSA